MVFRPSKGTQQGCIESDVWIGENNENIGTTL